MVDLLNNIDQALLRLQNERMEILSSLRESIGDKEREILLRALETNIEFSRRFREQLEMEFQYLIEGQDDPQEEIADAIEGNKFFVSYPVPNCS